MPMPIIKPVSDLRNYNAVLRDVGSGAPVFLTKNGRGRYVLMSIEDYGLRAAPAWLCGELEKGRRSGVHEGWTEQKEVLARVSERNGDGGGRKRGRTKHGK